MTAAEVRQSFLDFFKAKEHAIVPSAPLLPTAPNLLFTNAGMNPFVPYFLGERQAVDRRVADTQKCIRAGGKHNDLDDVGVDAYHHTFFEMLGNWSFGDYFKAEAITWAWELLTEVWGFPKQRLYATIYAPSEGDPASFDQDAYDFWKAIFEAAGLDPAVHIVNGNRKDNFWMMGDTGPCGPCSELHVDLTPKGDTKGSLVNQDSPWCIEVWNLVFMQFNATPDGDFVPLKSKHVDTGMGFERVAGILATTEGFTRFDQPPSNYRSDLFAPIFSRLEAITGHKYLDTLPEKPEEASEAEQKDVAYRILADHIRCLSCAIADGILPGNEGRNYVLRRILRRAVLWSHRIQLPPGSFAKLSEAVVEALGPVFPELEQQATVVRKVLEAEEGAFQKTIDRGLQMVQRIAEGADRIGGEEAFQLYDTYGFPFDLTEIVAREQGLTVDAEGFAAAMERQREQARAARKTSAIEVVEGDDGIVTEFVGYDFDRIGEVETTVQQVVTTDDVTWLVTETTPFYAELGGQVGDIGSASMGDTRIEITDTQKRGGEVLHRLAQPLEAEVGQAVTLRVDTERRQAIQRHHTATHVLHWALREVLGTHLRQAGSLVSPERLRFDYTHFEAPSPEQLRQIEDLANAKLLENAAVAWQEVPFAEKPDDVLAFFGDKYGDVVRIVDIGGWSKELCGGTHVRATGEIGLIKIVGESSISAGTRRLEAVAGQAALDRISSQEAVLDNLSRQLSAPLDEVADRIGKLIKERASLEKQVKAQQQKGAAAQAGELAGQAQDLTGIRVVTAVAEVPDPNALRQLAVSTLRELGEGVVVLGAALGPKASIVATVSPAAIQAGYQAGAIVRSATSALGGKGGGKPDFAMGGASKVEGLAEALAGAVKVD